MRRQVLNLTLLTALLTPMAIGTEIISDEELDDVSGAGVQGVVTPGLPPSTHQDNNNDSLVVHTTGGGGNILNLAVSVGAGGSNLLYNVRGGSVFVDQSNNQCNKNIHTRQHQEVINGGDLGDGSIQDNQNASVLLTNGAQNTGGAIYTVNAAVSAVGVATNIASMLWSTAGSVTVIQSNEQKHDNEVALSDIDTINPSMACGGKNREGCQYIGNGGDMKTGAHQRNSQGSVFITDDAQANRQSLHIVNIALSAANSGINIASDVSSATDAVIIQTNTQNAANKVAGGSVDEQYEFRQEVDNAGDVWGQDNNNLSVFINKNGQNSAQGINIVNAAASAINAGVNITANVQAGNNVTINQTNEQIACNWVQTDNPQDVYNGGSVLDHQYNNNGSVVVGPSSPSAVILINAAKSAVSDAANIVAGVTCTGPGCSVSINQTNTQIANNVVGATTTNPGCIACP